MASPAISEASEVRRRGRQRLIGAVALVAILVVFVPMVLDSEPRPPRPEKDLAIPPKSSAPPLPAPPPAPSSPRETANAVSGPAPKVEPPQKAAVLETKQVSPKAPPSATPAQPPPGAAAASAAPPKLEGFAVQVGAFRDEAKLAQARQKLATAGVVHYTERLEAKEGPLTRLRAGPFPTRQAAESALATLKRAALDGKVVTLP
jgi:DedD protein